MSRRETMLEERWRVHVIATDGRVTHGSTFRGEDGARGYFDSLAVVGSSKVIERRMAGDNYYRIVLREEMR